MRIFFDARYVRFPRHDGISRYSAELVTALSKIEPDLTLIISDTRQLDMLPELPFVKIHSPTSPLEPFTSMRLNHFAPDVVFSPMQTIGSMRRRFKLAVTVHDMIYYTHRTPPAFLPLPVRGLWRLYHLSYWPQRFLLHGTDMVVTVSDSTERELREHDMASALAVVPNAADASFARIPKKKRLNTLLYMGAFTGYKNVETLVKAMEQLPDYTLYLLSSITPEREDELSRLDIHSNVVFEHGVDDARYRELLASSTALVSASKAEGFGIPLLEAITAGVPVIASDTPIFHEVAGNAALYFDPDSVDGFVNRVRDLEKPETRKDLKAAGKTQTEKFSWDESARKLQGVLRDLLDTDQE